MEEANRYNALHEMFGNPVVTKEYNKTMFAFLLGKECGVTEEEIVETLHLGLKFLWKETTPCIGHPATHGRDETRVILLDSGAFATVPTKELKKVIGFSRTQYIAAMGQEAFARMMRMTLSAPADVAKNLAVVVESKKDKRQCVLPLTEEGVDAAEFINVLNLNADEAVEAGLPVKQILECSQDQIRACTFCGVLAPKRLSLLVCSRCKMVRYCGRECQAAHWKKHRLVCRNFSSGV